MKNSQKKKDVLTIFFETTNFLTIFLFEDLSGRRTSRYRRRPGFSPSMPLLVFWPHASAWGAGVILPPCAQLLWHELYVIKSLQKKKKKKNVEEEPTIPPGLGRQSPRFIRNCSSKRPASSFSTTACGQGGRAARGARAAVTAAAGSKGRGTAPSHPPAAAPEGGPAARAAPAAVC